MKYPLPCGCAGPKYVSKCETHQAEDRREHALALGIGVKQVIVAYFEAVDALRLTALKHSFDSPEMQGCVIELNKTERALRELVK